MSSTDDDRIRLAEPDDLLGVLQLMSRADEDVRPAVQEPSKVQRGAWAEMLGTDALWVYVAEVEATVVGTASFLRSPNLGYDCRPSGFIEAMVVASSHRRQGIASAILRRILADASDAGCHKIQLLAHKRHATDGAHALYRSLGFEAEAEGFRLYLDESY